MVKILFVCHGNICRSPMAEYVMKDMAQKHGISDNLYIDSAATSTDEIGNGVHIGTRSKLHEVGIPVGNHKAIQIVKHDYEKYDYIIGMDRWNMKNLNKILGGDPDGKIYRLLDFTERGGDIADPWYTGDFDTTYADVKEGCEGLIKHICENDFHA